MAVKIKLVGDTLDEATARFAPDPIAAPIFVNALQKSGTHLLRNVLRMFVPNEQQYHREFIQRKLEEAEGNVSRAAELMGVDRSHLYRRMRALGIQNRGERSLP